MILVDAGANFNIKGRGKPAFYLFLEEEIKILDVDINILNDKNKTALDHLTVIILSYCEG